MTSFTQQMARSSAFTAIGALFVLIVAWNIEPVSAAMGWFAIGYGVHAGAIAVICALQHFKETNL